MSLVSVFNKKVEEVFQRILKKIASGKYAVIKTIFMVFFGYATANQYVATTWTENTAWELKAFQLHTYLQTALILTSCPSTVWPSFSNIHRVPEHAHTHQWVKCLMFWTTSLPICVFHYLWLCQIRRHFCSTRKRQASQVQQWCFSASAKSASKMASTLVTVSDKTGTRSPLDPRRVGANVAPSAF